jgi:hypothetical protein
MASKTTTRTTRKPKLVNDGHPRSKGGKGGVVTQHGVTTTGYQRGCRCEECVAAMTEARRKARERKVPRRRLRRQRSVAPRRRRTKGHDDPLSPRRPRP